MSVSNNVRWKKNRHGAFSGVSDLCGKSGMNADRSCYATAAVKSISDRLSDVNEEFSDVR